jgi:hypothetical protein
MRAQPDPKNADAARAGGGAAETTKKFRPPFIAPGRRSNQAQLDWLRRTLHWQLALAEHIADADSRIVTACSRAEVDAIAAQVRAFVAHCERGGAA